MINGLNNYSGLFNNNSASNTSTSSKIDDIINEHKKSAALAAETNTSSQANIHLSTRAQKINIISSEFFGGGGPNFEQLEQLKKRVYQAGLISKQEYAHLTKTEVANDKAAPTSKTSTTTVSNYIDDLITRLNKDDKAKKDNNEPVEESKTIIELKKTLATAKTIIADVDKAKTSDKFKETLTQSLAFLNETISAKEFRSLPIDDQRGLTKVYQTLKIVDKLSPGRLTDDRLNHYLKNSFS